MLCCRRVFVCLDFSNFREVNEYKQYFRPDLVSTYTYFSAVHMYYRLQYNDVFFFQLLVHTMVQWHQCWLTPVLTPIITSLNAGFESQINAAAPCTRHDYRPDHRERDLHQSKRANEFCVAARSKGLFPLRLHCAL